MPRQDEGQDIGGDLAVGQAAAGVVLLVAGREQGGQQVIRRRLTRGQLRPPPGHQRGHPRFKELRRAPAQHPSDPGNPVRRAQHVQRIDPGPDRQIAVQRRLEIGGVILQLVRKQGRRKDLERQRRHLGVDLQPRLAAGQFPAGDPFGTDLGHAAGQGGGARGGEQGGQDAPGAAPVRALGQQQPFGQKGAEHDALQPPLFVVGGVVGQDVANPGRVADHHDRAEPPLAEQLRLGEVTLRPDQQRITPALVQERDQRQRLSSAGRSPRTKRLLLRGGRNREIVSHDLTLPPDRRAG